MDLIWVLLADLSLTLKMPFSGQHPYPSKGIVVYRYYQLIGVMGSI
jgi:hypothetical protein